MTRVLEATFVRGGSCRPGFNPIHVIHVIFAGDRQCECGAITLAEPDPSLGTPGDRNQLRHRGPGRPVSGLNAVTTRAAAPGYEQAIRRAVRAAEAAFAVTGELCQVRTFYCWRDDTPGAEWHATVSALPEQRSTST